MGRSCSCYFRGRELLRTGQAGLFRAQVPGRVAWQRGITFMHLFLLANMASDGWEMVVCFSCLSLD